MKQNELIKRYTDDDLVVVWQPSKCSHSKNCFHGLPKVFNPDNRPWVNLSESKNKDIIAQVKQCPSGALSIEGPKDKAVEGITVKVAKGGPLLIDGNLVISLPDGEQVEKQGMTALCRCGASQNKPYCDGSHRNIDFDV